MAGHLVRCGLLTWPRPASASASGLELAKAPRRAGGTPAAARTAELMQPSFPRAGQSSARALGTGGERVSLLDDGAGNRTSPQSDGHLIAVKATGNP